MNIYKHAWEQMEAARTQDQLKATWSRFRCFQSLAGFKKLKDDLKAKLPRPCSITDDIREGERLMFQCSCGKVVEPYETKVCDCGGCSWSRVAVKVKLKEVRYEI